jgi:dihydrofolate synthase / folylpolyglutamate synthase
MAEVEADLHSRWPESQISPSLDRVRDVLHLLGDPQGTMPVLMIAGTNGKSSTARMADSLLRATGLRVGRYTSPHLESLGERITLDGRPVDEERFVAAYSELLPYLDVVDSRHEHRLSFFEVMTVLAYAVFADAPVDVAVVEVGLGGTWDATNVADAQVAVVTPIGLDHQEYLGDTVTDIAREKAGIIKSGAFAVLSEQSIEAADVLLQRAADVNASVVREGLEFGVLSRAAAVGGQQVDLRGLAGEYGDLFLPLYGDHQAHNAVLALAAVEAFLGGGAEPLEHEIVRTAFAEVDSPGRLEVVRRGPTVLIDAAHNPAGAEALARALVEDFSFDWLVGVVGAMRDKDAHGILEALEPVLNHVVVTQSASPRAANADELGAIAVDVFGSDRVTVTPVLPDAIDEAMASADEHGPAGAGVLVTGSVVTAGQARSLLWREAEASE